MAISLFCQGECPDVGKLPWILHVDLTGRRGVRVRRPRTIEVNWKKRPEAQECKRPLEAEKDED